jgi:hypothetical protein
MKIMVDLIKAKNDVLLFIKGMEWEKNVGHGILRAKSLHI